MKKLRFLLNGYRRIRDEGLVLTISFLQDSCSMSIGFLEHVCRTSGAGLQDSWSMSAGLLEQFCRTPGACLKNFWSRPAGLLEHVCRTSGAGLQDSWGRPAGGGLPDQRLRRAVGLVSE